MSYKEAAGLWTAWRQYCLGGEYGLDSCVCARFRAVGFAMNILKTTPVARVRSSVIKYANKIHMAQSVKA